MADWRVLVVEDDPVVAGLHCRFVSRVAGFTPVGAAPQAARALGMVRTLRPHLILLDLGLPGEDGLGLLRRLRSDAAPGEAVCVTPPSAGARGRAAAPLGAGGYLVQPVRQQRPRQ